MTDLGKSVGNTVTIAGRIIDFERHYIKGPDGETRLEPKVAAVLARLVVARGDVVSRADLIDDVWSVEHGADESLTRAVSLLRRALGDTNANRRIIETIPKRGYRLDASAISAPTGEFHESPGRPQHQGAIIVAAIAIGFALTIGVALLLREAPPHDDAPGAPASGKSAARNVIAVLPFDDMSENGDQGWFADGVAEEILNTLASVPNLNVVGRSSSFAFRDQHNDLRAVGEKLNASYVLEGSVRRDGVRIRITAQLIDTEDGFHVWSQTYDRQLSDVFAVQDSIANEIVSRIAADLSVPNFDETRAVQTKNIDAYAAFLRGRNQERTGIAVNLMAAADHYKEAVAHDPAFVQAYIGLSSVYTTLQYVGGTRYHSREELKSFSRHYADQAIALAPNSADAFLWRSTKLLDSGDWIGAREALERAYKIQPGSVRVRVRRSMHFSSMGYIDAATKGMERNIAADPFYARYHGALSASLYLAGDYDRAITEADLGWELGHRMGWFPAMMIYADRGDYEKAEDALSRFTSLKEFTDEQRDELRTIYRSVWAPQYRDGAIAYVRAVIENDEPTWWLASRSLLPVWGLTEEAFDDFQLRSGPAPNGSIWYPYWKPVRDLPDFETALAEKGYKDYWERFGWPDFCAPDEANPAGFECE